MKLTGKRNVLFAATIAIASVFLFFGGPDSLSPARSVNEVWNFGHIIYFGLFTFLLNQSLRFHKYTVVQRWCYSLLIVFLLGIIIEVLQYGTDRTPDLGDLSRNLTGALLVLAFSPTLSSLLARSWSHFSRVVVATIFILQLLPFTIAIYDEAMARSQFPVLANFDSGFELDRWKGGARYKRASLEGDEAKLLKVELATTKYSGAGMQYFPADWSGYNYAKLRFYQPQEEPLSVTVRIHDASHNNQYSDRFNKRYTLLQGWTEVAISLTEVKTALVEREMDLARVRNISFFSSQLKQARVVYLDTIYLSF